MKYKNLEENVSSSSWDEIYFLTNIFAPPSHDYYFISEGKLTLQNSNRGLNVISFNGFKLLVALTNNCSDLNLTQLKESTE